MQSERIAGLDEIRGISILLVLFAHFYNLSQYAGFEHFHVGAIGVEIFFVLSGFLIARILFSRGDVPGAIKHFYSRRLLRILPLYLLVIAGGVTVHLLRHGSMNPIWFYLASIQNFLYDFAFPKSNWVSSDLKAIQGLTPLWSLAIELQFYLVVPLLLLKLEQTHSAIILVLLAACSLFSTQFDIALLNETSWFLLSVPKASWAHIPFFACGILLNYKKNLAWISLVVIAAIASSVGINGSTAMLSTAFFIASIAIVGWTVSKRPIISSRILARLGVVSYGIYMIHVPILIAYRQLTPTVTPSNGTLYFAIYGILCYLIAELSFRCFESYFLKIGRSSHCKSKSAVAVSETHNAE